MGGREFGGKGQRFDGSSFGGVKQSNSLARKEIERDCCFHGRDANKPGAECRVARRIHADVVALDRGDAAAVVEQDVLVGVDEPDRVGLGSAVLADRGQPDDLLVGQSPEDPLAKGRRRVGESVLRHDTQRSTANLPLSPGPSRS